MITTETKTIYKLPLSIVTYPEKNLIFYCKVKEEKAEKKQKKVQEEMLQEKDKEAQMTKDMDVKIMMENQEKEQDNVCIKISRGHLENLSITGNTEPTTLELTEI